MTPKSIVLLALGAAALACPAAASAQQYYERQYNDQRYERPRGDYWDQGRRVRGGVYPEFSPMEQRIRQLIQEGLREDTIEPDDARDLMGQLGRIQSEERREYRVHGWDLPGDDRERIRSELSQLDQLIDQIRAEP